MPDGRVADGALRTQRLTAFSPALRHAAASGDRDGDQRFHGIEQQTTPIGAGVAAVVVGVTGDSWYSVTGGSWYSPYDDRYIEGPSGLVIDHLVPLAEAWDSGASTWTPVEREAYANDLGDERDLIAVSAASNRSKADQDPSTWLPPAAGYHCTYATDWIAETRWNLTIGTPEQTALAEVLEQCPDAPITVTLARSRPGRNRPPAGLRKGPQATGAVALPALASPHGASSDLAPSHPQRLEVDVHHRRRPGSWRRRRPRTRRRTPPHGRKGAG
ncbi:HNH endonuclease family protein [Streptomyces sp. NPDC093260]|uniref:HNH endonuclease family protein n=1 Tax=Streptomyces sp. NPDC093260 TaxID=3155073 RepID=UPI003432AC99